LLTRLLHSGLIQVTRLASIRLPRKENLVHNIINRRPATVWTIIAVHSLFRAAIDAASSKVTSCYHHTLEINKSRILAPPTILSQPRKQQSHGQLSARVAIRLASTAHECYDEASP
jgi:hypothetical protein